MFSFSLVQLVLVQAFDLLSFGSGDAIWTGWSVGISGTVSIAGSEASVIGTAIGIGIAVGRAVGGAALIARNSGAISDIRICLLVLKVSQLQSGGG